MSHGISAKRLKRHPSQYDFCPCCKKLKTKISNHCFSCMYKMRRGKNHPMWNGGIEEQKKRKKIYQQSERGRAVRKACIETKQNFILNFKAQVGCQYDFCSVNNPIILLFHHPNGRRKNEHSIGSYASWEAILNRCKECVVLCYNHHTLEHKEKLI